MADGISRVGEEMTPETLKDIRITHQIGLREMASKLMILPAELCHMENGDKFIPVFVRRKICFYFQRGCDV